MSLLISIFLVIATVMVNFIFIVITRKFKFYKPIMGLEDKYKIECFRLLNKLWKKQITILSIGITLCFLSIFIDSSNKIVSDTFIILSIVYSFIAIVSGIYNYNSFNKGIYYLLNKSSK